MPNYGLDHLKSVVDPYVGAYEGHALPILLPEDVWSVSAERTTLTRQWVVAMSRVRSGSGVPNYAGVFPGVGEECPDHSWMSVESYRVRQKTSNGKLAIVEQVCVKAANQPAPVPGDPDADPPQLGDPGYTVDPDQLPPDELVIQGATQQIDIRRHHLFETNNVAWGTLAMRDFWDAERGEFNFENLDLTVGTNAVAMRELNGLTHFLVGGFTARTRTYSLNEPAEATFFGVLGTFAVPAGITYTGDPENWMIIGGTREERNGIWVLELVYLYSEKAWPDWLEAGGAF